MLLPRWKRKDIARYWLRFRLHSWNKIIYQLLWIFCRFHRQFRIKWRKRNHSWKINNNSKDNYKYFQSHQKLLHLRLSLKRTHLRYWEVVFNSNTNYRHWKSYLFYWICNNNNGYHSLDSIFFYQISKNLNNFSLPIIMPEPHEQILRFIQEHPELSASVHLFQYTQQHILLLHCLVKFASSKKETISNHSSNNNINIFLLLFQILQHRISQFSTKNSINHSQSILRYLQLSIFFSMLVAKLSKGS